MKGEMQNFSRMSVRNIFILTFTNQVLDMHVTFQVIFIEDMRDVTS